MLPTDGKPCASLGKMSIAFSQDVFFLTILQSLILIFDAFLYLSLLVTHTVSLQATAMKQYVAPLETPLSKFSILLLGYLFDLLVQKLNYTAMNLHDPLCIGFFIDLESEADYTQVGWKVQERDIRIEADGRLTRGMLVVDRRIKSTKEAPGEPSFTQVVVQADAERYLASMFYDIWGASYP